MLALDCGNTALKCVCEGEYNTFYLWPLASLKTALDDYFITLDTQEPVVLSCVASEDVKAILLSCIEGYFEQPLLFATTEKHFGALKNGYRVASQLGVDRWLAMVACSTTAKNKIIIDAGSWIKMDVVLANGQHLGGVIISKSSNDEKALINRFSLANISKSTALYGTSTEQCIAIVLKQYGNDAIIARLKKWLDVLSSPYDIIVSGGGAKPLSAFLQHALQQQNEVFDIQQKENLVLSGLLARYQH